MNFIYIGAILVQLGVIVFFIMRGRKQKARGTATTETPAPDTFDGHRLLALEVSPFQLKLAIPDDQTFVYGVVMDWNTGETMVTLATYITGAANLYLSNGGGVKGGGKSPEVGEAAVRLVTAAQEFNHRVVAASTADLPAKDCVRFFLLTNKGIFAAQEQVKYLDNHTSPWLPLFEKANEVIGAMKS